MIYPSSLHNIFSNRKYFFWFGHTIFWLAVFTETIVVFSQSVESLISFLWLCIITLEGYFITFCLHLIYKKYFWHRWKILSLIIIAFIYSFIAGILWSFMTQLLGNLLFDIPLKLPRESLFQLVSLNYTTIFLWSCLYLGYKIWEEWNNQKYLLEHERALLKTSQLEMLKYQLNPHFLFNTLSSLRGLITVDQLKAREMVTQISEFLRYSLLEGKNNEVQLIKEIEIIKQYLNIEQVRYNEDLIVEFKISPETNDFMIPIFLIHPLVENAVKHGMQTSSLPLKIYISSSIIDNYLFLQVKNSGKWIDENDRTNKNGTSVGLQNIQKRLDLFFADDFTFEIIKDPEFVKVEIKIKCKTS